MDNDQLQALLTRCLEVPDGQALDRAGAEALKAYATAQPCYPAAALILLRHNALTEEETVTMRQRLALECSDPRTLAFAEHGDKWTAFYPPQQHPEPKETVDVIDTFLRTYGSCSPEEEALLERMIFNPTPDYAGMLAREEQENLPADEPASEENDPQQARINAFILSQHPATQKPELLPEDPTEEDEPEEEKAPVVHPEHTDDSLLSESLAKIFIKRGRYERAYEIISGLNLKFPKKSAYFADQLRFLQKLIINQRHQEQQNGSSGAADK